MMEDLKYVHVFGPYGGDKNQIYVSKPWLMYSFKFDYFIEAKFSAN